MIGEEDGRCDLARLVVPRCGLLEATGDPFEPYRLVDAHGVVVGPVAVYLRELQACGRPATTQRSYGMDLLRWFRFLWAAGIGWGGAAGRMLTTTRRSLTVMSAAAGTVPWWCSGCRGVSRTRSLISCSPRCRPTGTGPLSPSGCRPGPGPRSCWAPRRVIQIRGSS